MRVNVLLTDEREISGVLLYKDTVGVFLRVGKTCKFIPWEKIGEVKTVRGKVSNARNID